MSRLLTLLMIVILVMTHGSSVAAAICRHDSVREHVAARLSHDSRAAAVALGEEAAASVEAKTGSGADSGSVSWPADMLPIAGFEAPLGLVERIDPELPEARMLAGTSPPPLLEPPTA